MLIINQNISTQRFIVTVSEINPVTAGSTLSLFNQFTNVSTQYSLENDLSEYPDRYNLFELPTSTFSGLTINTYIYTITDSNNAITETGLLKVLQDVLDEQEIINNEYIFITPNPSDNEYIEYQS